MTSTSPAPDAIALLRLLLALSMAPKNETSDLRRKRLKLRRQIQRKLDATG